MGDHRRPPLLSKRRNNNEKADTRDIWEFKQNAESNDKLEDFTGERSWFTASWMCTSALGLVLVCMYSGQANSQNVLEFWPLRFTQVVKTKWDLYSSSLLWHGAYIYWQLHLSLDIPSINNLLASLEIDPGNYSLMGWPSLPDFALCALLFTRRIGKSESINQNKSAKSSEEPIWEVIVKYPFISGARWRPEPVSQIHYLNHY